MSEKIIGYRIQPVYASAPGMVMTAALQTCAVTGKMLSSMGGGMGTVISPEVYEKLLSPEGKAFFADLRENYGTGGAAVL